MSDFKPIAGGFLAAGQIEPADIAQAKQAGVVAVVNNRPDGEVPDQPPGEAIRAAADEAGLAYTAIPIGPNGFGLEDVEALASVLDTADGPVLGFCRTGTRSTLLWALVQAHKGRDLDEVAGEAAEAGYDVSPVRPAMEQLAARARA